MGDTRCIFLPPIGSNIDLAFTAYVVSARRVCTTGNHTVYC